MSEAIQRYGECWHGHIPRANDNGDYVLYDAYLAAVAKLEAEHNKELARWQHDIYNYLCCVIGEPLYRIDGGACDSGDPLDFTLMEIKQCVEILKENADAEIAALREQLARMQAPEPADTYSMAQPSPLRYVPMVTAAGTGQHPAAQEPTFTLEQVRKVVQDEGDRISWQGFGAQESFADAVCALLAAGFRAELAKEASNG